MRRTRLLAATLFVAVAAAAPRDAHAQTKPENAAAAQQLFDDAIGLMKAGKAQEACPKLEASQKLDPGMGTQFRLGECYEQSARLASAWSVFVEVADAAKQAGMADREVQARKRAEVLQPWLPRLKLVVPPETASVAGVEISRDGVPIGKALWGMALPLDAGAHVVSAKAPGKTWKRTVAVKAGTVTELAVLFAEPPPPAPATPAIPVAPVTVEVPTPAEPSGSGRRAAGLVVGGVGLVGLVLGGVFGAKAISKQSDAKPHCQPGNHCDAEGLALEQDGVTAGNVSTVGFIAGGVLVAAGTVLFLTAPSPAKAGALTRAGARVGVGPRGLVVTGSW